MAAKKGKPKANRATGDKEVAQKHGETYQPREPRHAQLFRGIVDEVYGNTKMCSSTKESWAETNALRVLYLLEHRKQTARMEKANALAEKSNDLLEERNALLTSQNRFLGLLVADVGKLLKRKKGNG